MPLEAPADDFPMVEESRLAGGAPYAARRSFGGGAAALSLCGRLDRQFDDASQSEAVVSRRLLAVCRPPSSCAKRTTRPS